MFSRALGWAWPSERPNPWLFFTLFTVAHLRGALSLHPSLHLPLHGPVSLRPSQGVSQRKEGAREEIERGGGREGTGNTGTGRESAGEEIGRVKLDSGEFESRGCWMRKWECFLFKTAWQVRMFTVFKLLSVLYWNNPSNPQADWTGYDKRQFVTLRPQHKSWFAWWQV